MNDLTALDRAFTEAGFTLARHIKHKIWRCPCGDHTITSSGSRHGGRGDSNARALLARTRDKCARKMRRAA
jgi:hypothetical protein